MNNQLNKLKSDLEVYTKNKEQIFADYMRLEGIIMYLKAEIEKISKQNIDNPSNNN
jgi:hypothetical protein